MTSILALAPADAHALSMVAILVFAMGTLVTMFFVMVRNGKKHQALDLPELPEEEDEPDFEKPAFPGTKKKEPSADWEKDGDWWK